MVTTKARSALGGKHNYTRVLSTRGKEDPGFQLQARCIGRQVAVGPPTLPGAELVANSLRSSVPDFQVFKNSPSAPAYVNAGINETSYGLSISRFAGTLAPSAAFEYSEALDAATVKPPVPFSGTGSYIALKPRDRRWSRTLTVDLPGRDNVSLTHSPIRAFTNPARWTRPRPKGTAGR
jgi:hypothetical protein